MSGKYNAAREAFGEGSLSWTRDRIVAQLVSAEYVFAESHTAARDLKGKVGEPVVLEGKSIKSGRARAAKLVFRQVTGSPVVAIVLHRAPLAGSSQAGTLIAYLNGVDKFPMVPNGGHIEVDVPEQGFFRL